MGWGLAGVLSAGRGLEYLAFHALARPELARFPGDSVAPVPLGHRHEDNSLAMPPFPGGETPELGVFAVSPPEIQYQYRPPRNKAESSV